MKKYFVLSAVTALSLTMGACSLIVPKSASTSETKASVETVTTVESKASSATTEAENKTQDSQSSSAASADVKACEDFNSASMSFKEPTEDPRKDPEKFMEALKPLATPAYEAAETANDPELKEAFQAFGNLSENGVKTDPKIAQNMTKYVMTILQTCQSLGVKTDAMVGK